MKKIHYLILMITLVAGNISCKKYIEISPQDFLSPESYYKNEAQLTAALAGVYDVMGLNGGYGRNLVKEMALATDEGFCRSSSGIAADFYNHDVSDNRVLDTWKILYLGIERANMLLENMDRADAKDEVKAVIRGEALFLRAYYYFLLVANWGEVPLKLKASESVLNVAIPKAPAKDIYAQITKDMETAEGLVKEITEWNFGGRVSKSAVQGILARVYLNWAGRLNDPSMYTQARNWAQKVILSKKHSLNPDYTQVFINLLQDKYDIKESIWECEFFGNNIGSPFTEFGSFEAQFGPPNTETDPAGYSYGLVMGTYRFFTAFHNDPVTNLSDDVRRDWTLCPWVYVGNKGTAHVDYDPAIKWRLVGKYRRELTTISPKNKNGGPCNFPILRYADVLLMFAEADNAVNGSPSPDAYDAINQVRRRAYAKPIGVADPTVDVTPGLGKDDFLTTVQEERFKELAFEGIRKLDLLRWGIFMKVMKEEEQDVLTNGVVKAPSWPGINVVVRTYQNVTAPRHLLLPIPAAEISLNSALEGHQNEGW